MPNSFDQFDSSGTAVAEPPQANSFDQFDQTQNSFDKFDASSTPAPAPDNTLPAAPPTPPTYQSAPIPKGLSKSQLQQMQIDQRVSDIAPHAIESALNVAEPITEDVTPSAILNTPQRLIKLVNPNSPNAQDVFQPNTSIAPAPRAKGTGTIAGLENIAGNVWNGITTPESIVTLPLAVQSRLVTAIFGTQMASQLPDEVQTAIKTLKDPNSTTADKVEALGNPAVNAAMIVGLAKITGKKTNEAVEQIVNANPNPPEDQNANTPPEQPEVKAEPIVSASTLQPSVDVSRGTGEQSIPENPPPSAPGIEPDLPEPVGQTGIQPEAAESTTPAAPTPEQLTTTENKLAGKSVNKPSVSSDYFDSAGDATQNPDWWVNFFRMANDQGLYHQENAYQIGSYLRNLGDDDAAPVIDALQQARQKMADLGKAARMDSTNPDNALGFLTQYPREAIEAARNEGSAVGVIPDSVGKPLSPAPEARPAPSFSMWSSSEPANDKPNYFSNKKEDADSYALGRESKEFTVTPKKTFDTSKSDDKELLGLFDKYGGLYEAPQNREFIKILKSKGYDSVSGSELGHGGESKWLVTFDKESSKQSPTPAPEARPPIESPEPPANGLGAKDPIKFAALKGKSGKVYTGQFHPLIEASMPEPAVERGFQTESGKFVPETPNQDTSGINVDVRGDLNADEIQDPHRRLNYAKKELANASGDQKISIERIIDDAQKEISEQSPTPSAESKTPVKPFEKQVGGKIVSNDWRKSFDGSTDIERKIDWLRAVANKKSTKQDLSDALNRAEQLVKQQKHGRLANTFYDISQNPASSAETKAKAKALYDKFWEPESPTTETGAGNTKNAPEPVLGEPKAPAQSLNFNEPWTMTKADYLKNRPDKSLGNEVAESTAKIDAKKRGSDYYAVKVKDAVRNTADKIVTPDRWQVKRKLSDEEKSADHREWVEAALKKGKAVPPEVLADYPDLQKQASPQSPQKFRVGNSPQLHSVVEKLPASPVEIANGEQPVRVKNEKTGETQIVNQSDLTPVTEKPAVDKAVQQSKTKQLNDQLRAANLDPDSFKTIAQKRAALKRANAISEFPKERMSAGPGAAATGQPGTYSAIQSLSDTLAATADQNRPVNEKVSAIERVKIKGSEIKDAISSHLANLLAVKKAMWDSYSKLAPYTDMKRIVGKWFYAGQKADAEAREFGKQIIKAVPDKTRREAITNWIQADGDKSLLKEREDASKPQYKNGYKIAQSLTPREIEIAGLLREYYDRQLEKGIQEGIFKEGLPNYITQVWRKENPITRKLTSDLVNSRLQPNFRYARKRIFDSYFEGEQAGYKPMKDAGALVANYDQSFNKSLAARAFVKDLHEGTASDGRPLVEVSGSGSYVNPDEPKPTFLIRPKTSPDKIGDYRTIDHPALRGWKWIGKSPNGGDILINGELKVHPEIYDKLKNRLSTSWFRQNPVARGLLNVQSTLKQSLMSVSAFHQVQENLHALGHKVNPFNLAKLDFDDPVTKSLAEHGLQLADHDALAQFGEGLSAGKLMSKIPGIGPKLQAYNDWLFQDNIPRLKLTMAKAALQRNMERYAPEIKSGKITPDQVLELTASQANHAFGELPYKYWGRNPNLQDAYRTFLLAPDFLEARAGFVGQALKPGGLGAKGFFKNEQVQALALLALTQYMTARILNQVLDKDPHWEFKNAFRVIAGNHAYSLRTVPGDIIHLLSDPRGFVFNRLSPLIGRGGLELATQRDYRGVKRDFTEQMADLLKSGIPIAFNHKHGQTLLETFGNAIGVQNQRYDAVQNIQQKAADWKAEHNIKDSYETLYNPDADKFNALRTALQEGNKAEAQKQFDVLKQTIPASEIYRHFRMSLNRSITGSAANDRAFVSSLDSVGKGEYKEAKDLQKARLQSVLSLK